MSDEGKINMLLQLLLRVWEADQGEPILGNLHGEIEDVLKEEDWI